MKNNKKNVKTYLKKEKEHEANHSLRELKNNKKSAGEYYWKGQESVKSELLCVKKNCLSVWKAGET
jgi:hypothetical protein